MLLLGVVNLIRNIKLHIQKYFFYDILALIIFIGINILTFNLIIDLYENEKSKYDYSLYDETIKQIYEIDPSLFKFDENNTAIVKMDTFLEPITNGKDTMFFGIVPLTKDQDQCVGYFIIKKVNSELQIDSSHICDMIDY